jgi:hypothetical protein
MARGVLPSAALALSVAALASAQAPLNLTVLPQAYADAYGAACLDGSPPSFYAAIRDPTRLVIGFEGGGWCFDLTAAGTISNCAGRAAGGGGSSKYNGPTMDVGGQLSTNPAVNPRFFNYSLVFVKVSAGTGASTQAWMGRDKPGASATRLELERSVAGRAPSCVTGKQASSLARPNTQRRALPPPARASSSARVARLLILSFSYPAQYCDGTSHSSNATAPVPVSAEVRAAVAAEAHAEAEAAAREGRPVRFDAPRGEAPSQIYFRGRSNLIAVMRYLTEVAGLVADPEEMFVTGGSAGATAAYYALDFIAGMFPKTKVVGSPDAGFFLDAFNVAQNRMWYRDCFQAADPIWNTTGSNGLNANCLAAEAANGTAWKCFLQEYASPYIQTPNMILNSAYDAWQITTDLQLGCAPTLNGQPFAGYASCNATQLATMQAYRDSQLRALAPALALPYTGAFVDSW